MLTFAFAFAIFPFSRGVGIRIGIVSTLLFPCRCQIIFAIFSPLLLFLHLLLPTVRVRRQANNPGRHLAAGSTQALGNGRPQAAALVDAARHPASCLWIHGAG